MGCLLPVSNRFKIWKSLPVWSKGVSAISTWQSNLAVSSTWNWLWRIQEWRVQNARMKHSWILLSWLKWPTETRHWVTDAVCMKSLRNRCVMLWKWNLGCSGHLKILGMPELWNICHRELPTGGRTRPGERSVLAVGSMLGRKSHLSLWLRHGAPGFGVCLARFWFCFCPVVPHYTLILPLGIEMYVLCHCVLVLRVFFFYLKGITVRSLPSVAEETLEFLILLRLKDYGNFSRWTQCILHYDMTISLDYESQEVECGGLSNKYPHHVLEYLVPSLWCCLGRFCIYWLCSDK